VVLCALPTRWGRFGSVAVLGIAGVACRPPKLATTPSPSGVSTRPLAAPAEKPSSGEAPQQCRAVVGTFSEVGLVAETERLHAELGYGTAPKSGRHRPCDEACVDRVAEPRKKATGGSTRSGFEPRPLAAPQARLCGLYLRYAEIGTDPQRARVFRYRRVKLLFHHNRFAEVRSPLVEFLAEDADDTLAVWAAQMLLDLLTVEWTQASDDATRSRTLDVLLAWLAEGPKLAMWEREDAVEYRSAARSLRVGALIARARSAAAATPPDYTLCAESYLSAVEPSFGQAVDVPLYEAAKCYDAAGNVAGARRAREALLELTPDSRLADDVRMSLAAHE